MRTLIVRVSDCCQAAILDCIHSRPSLTRSHQNNCLDSRSPAARAPCHPPLLHLSCHFEHDDDRHRCLSAIDKKRDGEEHISSISGPALTHDITGPAPLLTFIAMILL